MFLLAFTSAVIIFDKLIELHSTLSEKKIFVMNFPFSMVKPGTLNSELQKPRTVNYGTSNLDNIKEHKGQNFAETQCHNFFVFKGYPR